MAIPDIMGFLKQMDKSPKVKREHTLRISELAQRLALDLDPEAYTRRRSDTQLGVAVLDLAEYLDETWRCPQREHPMPPPDRWDSRYARLHDPGSMYAFTLESQQAPPRDHDQEVRAWRTALELSLSILEIGERRDPERWLDLMVKGAGPVTGHVAGGAAMRNPGFDDADGGIRSLVENTTPHPQGRVLGTGPGAGTGVPV